MVSDKVERRSVPPRRAWNCMFETSAELDKSCHVIALGGPPRSCVNLNVDAAPVGDEVPSPFLHAEDSSTRRRAHWHEGSSTSIEKLAVGDGPRQER